MHFAAFYQHFCIKLYDVLIPGMERRRERVCVRVYMCEREIVSVVCVCDREKAGACVRVCGCPLVCMCMRQRARERVSERKGEREIEGENARECVIFKSF